MMDIRSPESKSAGMDAKGDMCKWAMWVEMWVHSVSTRLGSWQISWGKLRVEKKVKLIY